MRFRIEGYFKDKSLSTKLRMKKLIKRLIPRFFYRAVHQYRINKFLADKNSTEEIFTDIYAKKIWAHEDDSGYSSGSGSLSPDTQKYISFLIDFVKENKVSSIFEIGCGDFRIMKNALAKMEEGCNYLGSDIVKPLIDYNNQHFSSEQITFRHINTETEEILPSADLCLVRQVFQHLSNKEILAILPKLEGYKYLLVTEHVPVSPKQKNADKKTGADIRLYQESGVFLDAQPFNYEGVSLLEYRSDLDVYGRLMPAYIRTSLVKVVD